jgi:hypothetical protein
MVVPLQSFFDSSRYKMQQPAAAAAMGEGG